MCWRESARCGRERNSIRQASGDKKVVKLMAHYEVDCDTQKYAVLRSIAYDGAGKVVGSSDVPQQMESTVPDTTAAVVVDSLCAVLSARKAANPSAR